MNSGDFAKRLADKTLINPANIIWVGEGAFMCRAILALERYLPFRLWPSAFSQGYGMKRIDNQHKN